MMALIGALFIIVVIAGCVAFKLRSIFLLEFRCPQCAWCVSLKRIPRNDIDRLIGQLVPSRKYQCGHCGWVGLIRADVARAVIGPAANTGTIELQTPQDTATPPETQPEEQ